MPQRRYPPELDFIVPSTRGRRRRSFPVGPPELGSGMTVHLPVEFMRSIEPGKNSLPRLREMWLRAEGRAVGGRWGLVTELQLKSLRMGS